MRLVDLTYPLDERTPVYPGDPFFRRTVICDHETDGFRLTGLSFGSHFGTHLDAPRHFFLDGEPLNSFDLSRFFPLSAVCDLTPVLSDAGIANIGPSDPLPDSLPVKITPEMLTPFSTLFERFEAVIIRTGWGEHWGKSDYFTHFPSIVPETAEWLADFPFRLLGLDTPSLSAYGSTLFAGGSWGDELDEVLLHSDAESHRILLGREEPILILENLAHSAMLPAAAVNEAGTLDEPQPAFRLCCFPLPVTDADGIPVRAAAVLEDAEAEE